MRLPERAYVFAKTAHAGQVRKYTGQGYITHPIGVAALVATVDHTNEMLAAALLHDTVEDAGIPLDLLSAEFGPVVADLVSWLTKTEQGDRASRMAAYRLRIADAPARAQTIKVADIIDNCRTIAVHDLRFAAVYLHEQAALLDVLQAADPRLLAQARAVIQQGWDELQKSIPSPI